MSIIQLCPFWRHHCLLVKSRRVVQSIHWKSAVGNAGEFLFLFFSGRQIGRENQNFINDCRAVGFGNQITLWKMANLSIISNVRLSWQKIAFVSWRERKRDWGERERSSFLCPDFLKCHLWYRRKKSQLKGCCWKREENHILWKPERRSLTFSPSQSFWH